MESNAKGGVSKVARWLGYILGAVPSLMMLMGVVMNFAKPETVAQGFAHTGYPEKLGLPIGIVALVCVILYWIPWTAVLGAILMTGYLGGAIATHVRIGEPFIVQSALGVLVWAGLFMRDKRVRSLIPFRF
jgi:hypothetical protein